MAFKGLMLPKHSAFFPKRKKLTHTHRQTLGRNATKWAKEEQQERRRWDTEQKWRDWKRMSAMEVAQGDRCRYSPCILGIWQEAWNEIYTVHRHVYISKLTWHLIHCSSQSNIPDNRSCEQMGQHSKTKWGDEWVLCCCFPNIYIYVSIDRYIDISALIF